MRRLAIAVATVALFSACGSSDHGLAPVAGTDLPPINSGPVPERHAAAAWVLVDHDGCLTDVVSQSNAGTRVRRLSGHSYRVYFLAYRDNAAGDDGGYDESRWMAYDVTLVPKTRNGKDGFLPTHMHAVPSPLRSLFDDCL